MNHLPQAPRYEIGDRVIVNMRNLNPDLIPPSLSPEAVSYTHLTLPTIYSV